MKRFISLMLSLVLLISVNSAVIASADTTKIMNFGQKYSVSSSTDSSVSYKLTLPKSGLVTFDNLSHEENPDESGNGNVLVINKYEEYTISVINSKSEKVYSESYSANPANIIVGQSKKMPCYILSGTYTVTVTVANTNLSFTPNFVSSDETFAESYNVNNNSTENADPLAFKTAVKGMLGIDDSEDYYSFTLSCKSYVDVSIFAECGFVNASSTPFGGSYSDLSSAVYNTNGDEIDNNGITLDGDAYGNFSQFYTDENGQLRTYETKERTKCITYLLNTGTYYLKISGVHVCLDPNYVLTLNNTCVTHTPVTDKAVAPTFAKAGKTVGTHCSVCGEVITAQKTVAKLVPSKTELSKLTPLKKSAKITWKKQTKNTSGYQIQLATDGKFTKGKKTVTVSGNKYTAVTVKKLSAKKKYFVRIRTYKSVSGKKYYSGWSKAKSVKTK